MKTLTKEKQRKITPNEAIELLRRGNERFLNNLRLNRNLLQQVNETAEGQYPFATILNCIDSRTPAELIFDQGLGDIFSVRIAGNIINDDILGSLEFSCKLAGSKLIMVLGHTSCGAIKGACDKAELGHLTTLLKKIEPAIHEKKLQESSNPECNLEFIDDVAKLNVKHSMKEIKEKSPVLKELIEQGQIGLIGGLYDIATGEVDFFE
ncbi:carbonic anhydrase family protein [Legionella impletisoli]|uniref:Carbonic anhydrase n=1 Tax=Legionella impletisoli TaxID=343510 RepID=A0A917NAL5_9GAMM|nr:carbonic anhydrase family protein [Legionella impletisoli]GGI78271.1 carbonic anhydrase [Legionella impletisoli]